MKERPPASRASLYGSWPRYEVAKKGFRNYWYPVIESRLLRKAPKAVQVAGERIMLMRDGGKVRGLNDRCPHRGVPLSAGCTEFPGTVSCIYHGWTYKLEIGELVAALTDGPDSRICRNVGARVTTYPVEDRAGVICVYIGDLPPPPIEENVPAEFFTPEAVVIPMIEKRPNLAARASFGRAMMARQRGVLYRSKLFACATMAARSKALQASRNCGV